MNEWPEDSWFDYNDARSLADHQLRVDLDAKWRTSSGAEIFRADFRVPELLVSGLDIGLGRPCGIWGLPSGGKNYLAQEIALAVAAKKLAFKRFPTGPGAGRPVIHITYDMGTLATSLRYRQLANGMGLKRADIEDRLMICAHPPINLRTDGMEELFAARLEGFALCILDNLRAATPGLDENDSNFGEVLAKFGNVARNVGCTVIYLHHTRKDVDKMDMSMGRGTGAIPAASCTIWAIKGQNRQDRVITCLREHDMSVEEPPTWGCQLVECAANEFSCAGRPGITWNTWIVEKDDK